MRICVLKIKKVCSYELIQLENADGSRPRGNLSRLIKTFLDNEFSMTFAPNGTGVMIKARTKDDNVSTVFIPFTNIPYVIIDESKESNEDGSVGKENTAESGKSKRKVQT